jgi:hypothetical protein
MRLRARTYLVLVGAVAVAACTARPAGPPTATTPAPATTVAPPTLPSPTLPGDAVPTAVPGRPAPTRQLLVAPVTTAGALASGYTVLAQAGAVTSCYGYAGYRPGDVVYSCLPAARAHVCWKSATPRQLLCLSSPGERTLRRVPTADPLGGVSAPGPLQPFALDLDNGDHCRQRTSHTGIHPPGRPDLYGQYDCDHGTAVWASEEMVTIDTHSPQWTVLVGGVTSVGLRTGVVAAAYYPSYAEASAG